MSEQVNLILNKIRSEINAISIWDMEVGKIKMNALTFVDLLSSSNNIDRLFFKHAKERGFIQLVNTMDRNKFELV